MSLEKVTVYPTVVATGYQLLFIGTKLIQNEEIDESEQEMHIQLDSCAKQKLS